MEGKVHGRWPKLSGWADASKQDKRHKKEISSLKRIIGEYAVVNDALKRVLEGGRECTPYVWYRR